MSDKKTLTQDELAAIFARSPMMKLMNLEILDMSVEQSRLAVRMPIRPEFERGAVGSSQFHGGAIAAFIDVVGDFALGITVGGGVPTMNLRIDYLRPGVGAYLDGVATVRRAGRTSAVVDIEVSGADGKLVALGRGTYVPITG
jgi:uncharacterized protein (TIGR00369 family)